MTWTLSPRPMTRSRVARNSVSPPGASGRRGFGVALRLSGHRRVPLPPASTRMWRPTRRRPELRRRLGRGGREERLGARVLRPLLSEVDALPREVEVAAPEVAVRGYLAIDRLTQFERAHDPEGR